MSYVTPGSPLPPNNADPLSECQRVLSCQIINGVEAAAAEGRARVQQIATPASFIALGLPVAKQVVSAGTMLKSAIQPGVAAGTGDPTSSKIQRRQPVKIIPLNVTQDEYSGCCIRGVDMLAPAVVQYQPRITIPPAPIVRDTSQGPLYLKPPVTAPPFMPAQAVQSVQQSQGPKVMAMPMMRGGSFVQNRLPVGRYMGFRGMGATWGDVGTGPCGQTWPVRKYAGGMSGKGWLLLAAIGIGAYAMSGRR